MVTFASKEGKAELVDGFIGKAYTNTSGDAKEAGYLKYNLAATNCINSLKSFTFSAWVKRPALGSGTFFSVNGGEHDWGSTMQFFFDNTGVGEDGATYQQFNARIDSYKQGEDGNKFQASCWPNVQAVRWTQTVQNMIADGATEFTECGPGAVLQGLIKKIDKTANAHGIE